jgi:hypothetical protein
MLPKSSINFRRVGHRRQSPGPRRGDALYADNPPRPGPAIAGNWGVGYGFASNPVASYDVAGIPVTSDTLLATGSPFMSGILVNTFMYCMLSQINKHILYILVNQP